MEKNKKLNISAVQMNSLTGNKQANFEKALTLIRHNVIKGADIIVLPEVWTVGWDCEEFRKTGEYLQNSETIKFLSNIAKEYNAYIIGGSFIQKVDNDTYYNSCPVIDRNGDLIGIYSKTHLYSYCGCTEGSNVKAGDKLLMVDIEGVKIGLSICYDIRFPEIFREYRKQGAELLINMAAWGSKKPIPWEMLTKARAIENQAYMIAITQCGPINTQEWNIGHSRVIDYLGNTVAEIKDQKEGAINCSICFDQMNEYRNECTILNDIKEKYEVEQI